MIDKRGSAKEWWASSWTWIVVLGAILAVTGFLGPNFLGQVYSGQSLQAALDQGQHSFGEVWSEGGIFANFPLVGENAVNPNNWKFLDYIFGKIPVYLIVWAGGISASIIVLGIWVIFFLVFLDALTMFGSFSKPVNGIIAFVLTLIIANLKLIMFITVLVLTITAVFGAFSVLASIILIFGVFIAWHFGTSGWREKLIRRRAESYALKASAGGDIAASGVDVLAKIAAEAKKANEAARR